MMENNTLAPFYYTYLPVVFPQLRKRFPPKTQLPKTCAAESRSVKPAPSKTAASKS